MYPAAHATPGAARAPQGGQLRTARGSQEGVGGARDTGARPGGPEEAGGPGADGPGAGPGLLRTLARRLGGPGALWTAGMARGL